MKKKASTATKGNRKTSPSNSARGRGTTADSMKVQSILVPTDFSAASEKALLYASNFVKHFGARLSLLHVIEPAGTPDFLSSFPLAMENSKVKAEFKRQLEKMLKKAGINRDSVDHLVVRYGRAYHQIAEAARDLKVDLIIISTHGYTGLKHILLGSSTEKVVRHAPCPVLVVRLEEHEFCSTPSEPSTEDHL